MSHFLKVSRQDSPKKLQEVYYPECQPALSQKLLTLYSNQNNKMNGIRYD